MMKKILTVLFVALLLMAACAWAEEAEATVYTSGDWEYALLEDGTAEITGYNGNATELTVPAEIDGAVVTSIGDYAFEYHGLTSITLPDSIVNIKANPFAHCPELTDIIVSPEHPTLATINGVLFEKTERCLVCYPCAFSADSYTIPQGIRSIGDGAFDGCDSLTSITLPDSLTTIGDGAFGMCAHLTSVTLPNSLTSIGDYAFYYCHSLTSITLPDSLTSIGDYAFRECAILTSITLPDSITSIGTNPFTGCSGLTDIIVSPEHPTLEVIAGVLFEKTEKRLVCYPCAFTASSYTVPQGIHIIGDYSFCGCYSLTSIKLPDSLTSIGDDAFVGCPRAVTLTIPRDSWLVQWCKDNGRRYTYSDSLN